MDTASGVGSTRHCSAGVKASAKGEQHMRIRDEGQSLPSGLGRSTAKGKGERGRNRKKAVKIAGTVQRDPATTRDMNECCIAEKRRLLIKYEEKMN